MDKKVKMNLVGLRAELHPIGLSGNTFVLLARFQKQARREGWTKEEIKLVMDDATSGDYDHLLQVLIDHCEDGE